MQYRDKDIWIDCIEHCKTKLYKQRDNYILIINDFLSFDIPGVVVGTDVVEDGPDVILGDDALVGCTAVTTKEKKNIPWIHVS